MIVGIDLGYGQVKGYTKDNQHKFLSVVGTPITDFARTTTIKDKEDLLDALCLTYNNTKYYIGYNAVINTRNGRFSLKQNKAKSEENKIKFLTSLALFDSDEDFIVVTGLPVLEFKNQKADLFNMMINQGEPFEFTFYHGAKQIQKSIKVSNVKVISQGEASFYDYILNDDGSINKEKASEVVGRVMVVDVGYKTTDIVTMENGKYVETMSDQLNQGVNQMHNECIKLIFSKYNIKKEMKEIDNIIRDGYLFYNKQDIDISDIVQKASIPFAEDIIDNLINISNDQLGALSTIILTGGGSSLIYDYINKQLNDNTNVVLMDNSEFSNARGYYKYGLLLKQNKAL